MKCMHCNEPIRKHTKRVQFAREPSKYHSSDVNWVRYVYIGNGPWPQTREDCLQFTNQQVVAVSRLRVYDYDLNKSFDRGIDFFKEWDGVSYRPAYKYFCSNHCAGSYARAVIDMFEHAPPDTKSVTFEQRGPKRLTRW